MNIFSFILFNFSRENRSLTQTLHVCVENLKFWAISFYFLKDSVQEKNANCSKGECFLKKKLKGITLRV